MPTWLSVSVVSIDPALVTNVVWQLISHGQIALLVSSAGHWPVPEDLGTFGFTWFFGLGIDRGSKEEENEGGRVLLD